MWHVSFRSGVATLRTAIHLLLTYLLKLNCDERKYSARTAALQPINFVTVTRVTNNASCNWVNMVQVGSVQFSWATENRSI